MLANDASSDATEKLYEGDSDEFIHEQLPEAQLISQLNFKNARDSIRYKDVAISSSDGSICNEFNNHIEPQHSSN